MGGGGGGGRAFRRVKHPVVIQASGKGCHGLRKARSKRQSPCTGPAHRACLGRAGHGPAQSSCCLLRPPCRQKQGVEVVSSATHECALTDGNSCLAPRIGPAVFLSARGPGALCTCCWPQPFCTPGRQADLVGDHHAGAAAAVGQTVACGTTSNGKRTPLPEHLSRPPMSCLCIHCRRAANQESGRMGAPLGHNRPSCIPHRLTIHPGHHSAGACGEADLARCARCGRVGSQRLLQGQPRLIFLSRQLEAFHGRPEGGTGVQLRRYRPGQQRDVIACGLVGEHPDTWHGRRRRRRQVPLLRVALGCCSQAPALACGGGGVRALLGGMRREELFLGKKRHGCLHGCYRGIPHRTGPLA